MSEIKVTGTTFDSIWDALKGIGNYGQLPFNMRIASNIQLLQTQAKRRQRLMYETTDKLVLKDENGAWKYGEDKLPIYENPAAVNKVFEEVNENEIGITIKEIDFQAYPEQSWNSLPANLLAPLLGIIVTNYEDQPKLKLAL